MSASLGDTAVQLPWLAPGVASLVALTRPHRPASAVAVRSDPGAMLLLLRNSPHNQPPEPFRPTQSAPAALRLAHDLLGQPPAGVLDRGHPAVQNILAFSRACAHAGRVLAERCGRVDPNCAAAGGLLVPLGWFAAAAIQPDAVAACLADGEYTNYPGAVEQRFFGTTTAELARRLARRWELPAWLTTIVGYLDLPAALATTFGGDPTLTTIVHVAVALAGQSGTTALRIPVGTSLDEGLARLGVTAQFLPEPGYAVDSRSDSLDDDPYDAPLLREVLELAAENAGRRELHLVPRLESEIDNLHRILCEQRAGEAERLRAQKLAALAEFAAGAGHEINNPLAVISGQAQYLLGLEAEPDRQRSLRTVVLQAQRIHQILTDLMLFARPARPQKRAVDVRDLIHEAAGGVVDLAGQRQVRVEVICPDEPCVADSDPKQILMAISGLLRNAVEAAGATGEAETVGWARVKVEIVAADRLRITVEDSGPGLAGNQPEHMFDPFFSGRSAGRGRGLGLPTAWRLARENGGDVAFEPLPGGPTRFVMTLPRIDVVPMAAPLAA